MAPITIAVVAVIRIFLPTACPDQAIFRMLAGRLAAAGP